jgi:hypothetical protein
MEVSGQLHAPVALPPGNVPLYPFDRRLGELQSRSGRGGEEKYSQPLPGLEPPIIQSVVQRYTTELSWLPLAEREFSNTSGNLVQKNREQTLWTVLNWKSASWNSIKQKNTKRYL